MKRILIVEDSRDISELLALRLKSQHFQVEIAEDAISAVKAAANNPPNLILLDIAIPAGDGFTVLKRISHLPDVVDAPFIFLTASKDPELKTRAMEMGAADFFEKPYDSAALMDAIHTQLENVDPSYRRDHGAGKADSQH